MACARTALPKSCHPLVTQRHSLVGISCYAALGVKRPGSPLANACGRVRAVALRDETARVPMQRQAPMCTLCGRPARFGFAAAGSSPTLRCWRHGLIYGPVLRRALQTALVVGTVLFLINYLEVVLSGKVTLLVVLKIVLAYLIPFLSLHILGVRYQPAAPARARSQRGPERPAQSSSLAHGHSSAKTYASGHADGCCMATQRVAFADRARGVCSMLQWPPNWVSYWAGSMCSRS